jgi:hypothetical protein
MEKRILKGRSTSDGAGVKLQRIFAHDHTELTDPFLLLDHFGSIHSDDYVKGFPWHPHRGIETVTYMLAGRVDHGDSIGNAGTIGPGDIQWMTAGGGVIHQEMPVRSDGGMFGLQLWVNLPASRKMMEPRYRGILAAEVPVVKTPQAEVRVIAGVYEDAKGPVRDLIVDVEYLDCRLQAGASFIHETKKNYTCFCYLISGVADIDGARLEAAELALFTQPGRFEVQATADARYIFVTGQKLHEQIAWGGPIVMNTQEELHAAFKELDEGTFLKNPSKINL